MANKHQPSLEGIPLEIKRVIALHLPAAANKNLVLVSRSFREVVEPINWSAIRIKPHHIDFARLRDWENASVDEQQSAVHAVEDAWRRCAELLRRDPRRQTWVKAMRGVVIDSAADLIRDVLELVKDSVKEISQEKCPVRTLYTLHDADSPALARAINAVRVLPHVSHLSLLLCNDWEMDAINVVRSTPRLKELTVRAYDLDEDEKRVYAAPIPHLPHLKKMHIDCRRWYAGSQALLAAAPELEDLTLWAWWAWSDIELHGIDELLAYMSNLKRLDLRGNDFACKLYHVSVDTDLGVYWPRLEALTIHAPVGGGVDAKISPHDEQPADLAAMPRLVTAPQNSRDLSSVVLIRLKGRRGPVPVLRHPAVFASIRVSRRLDCKQTARSAACRVSHR